MNIKKEQLPYRKNCEGYFTYKNNVAAKLTPEGYIVFPGGGIDENETPIDALLREATEEAGIVCTKKPKKAGMIHFDWGPGWAKTEKQKKRYTQFRGEEMHFFIGEVEKFITPRGDPSDAWKGKKYLPLNKVISLIEKEKPFDKDIKKYRKIQLKILYSLKNNKK